MVFHVDPDEMDFSRCSRIQESLEDLKFFTFWKTKRCPPPSLDYECTLLHGSPAWFGKGFLLLGSQIGLPDTIEQDEVASLLTWLAILGCSLQPTTVSGSSAIDATATAVGTALPLMTPMTPLPTPSSPTTTMADMMAEIRALRALVQVAPTASVPAPPTGMPKFSMAQIEDMSRIFGPGGWGWNG